MQFSLASTSLAIVLIATGSVAKGTTCESNQVVICKGNGNGGLLSLGNIASGLLGDNCSGGDVYCCSEDDVEQVCETKYFKKFDCLLQMINKSGYDRLV